MHPSIESFYVILAFLALTLLWQSIAIVVESIRWLKQGRNTRKSETIRPAASTQTTSTEAHTTLTDSIRVPTS